MADASYVRDQMLPPQAPPVTEAGAVKWLRENLFSGWFNTILTLVGVVVIYWLVVSALPWWLNSVWTAESLSECREIVAAKAGEGASGACWAMIRERWHQFIFGFYPPELWWRPVMAFGLLFAAMAPVLFAGQKKNLTLILAAVGLFLLVTLGLAGAPMGGWIAAMALVGGMVALVQVQPGKLLWFTALYPALCFWLLWGGSVWMPIVAMLGFVVMGVAYLSLVARFGPTSSAIGAVTLALLWWLFLDIPITQALASMIGGGLEPVDSDQFGGFLLAITIGVTAITFSLPIGILLALGRQSDMLIVKSLCVGFIEFIRGVPLITLLFTASLLLQYFLPPGTNFDII
ncbi:MAG: amino acid ABC transporter permease, partial [Rhodobacteraceae bacterium]|nr:amino acid ABC transporter permease [Paracoccaceae bacterium]